MTDRSIYCSSFNPANLAQFKTCPVNQLFLGNILRFTNFPEPFPKFFYKLIVPEILHTTKLIATATSFSYLFNAGMRFNTGKRIALILNADYSDYTPNFKNVQITSSEGTSQNGNVKQEIQTINISAGIAFRL